ncbi:uncharacterized protein LOC114335162 [Diabrotica virgifera virgifera]|uniref:Uncharacterized protein LOC114335162 n=1 Tax=Diabrotica virgifera virgifera TaxID=50390 RepID=A0A6P7G298_DIAVI|nr:uncharacterized protein LOC114335162 [Diabrotica virgifera virgifera]
MPPPAKKDCGLILFDVASPKKTELLNGLMKFCCYKWYMNSRSMYRVILVNSAVTDNDFNYPHIHTLEEEDFEPNAIFSEIEGAKPGQSNWIDALSLGVHHLDQAVSMKGLVTLQLIFFTTLDATKPLNVDAAKLSSLMERMNGHEIFLYIIGPNVKLPFVITNTQCISKCMNELQLPPGNQNLATAKKIITGIRNGVMCNTKIGLNLLFSYKNSPGGQPWKLPLSFGTKLSIPATTFKIFRSDQLIHLKLISSTSRSYVRTLAENRDVIVKEDEIVRGIQRHGKFMIVDDNMFRTETDRCFDIIGFSDKKFFPETIIRGETFYVLPDQFNAEAFQAFTHLVKVLSETNKYGICKRVYARGNKPKYFALIPNLDYKPKCLTMTQLPYGDYAVPHKFEEPKCPKEKIKQDDFSNFFNSLIIENPGSKTGTTLGPTMLLDINQHKLASDVTKKRLQRNDLDLDALNVHAFEKAPDNKFMDALKRSWPARDAPTTTRQ